MVCYCPLFAKYRAHSISLTQLTQGFENLNIQKVKNRYDILRVGQWGERAEESCLGKIVHRQNLITGFAIFSSHYNIIRRKTLDNVTKKKVFSIEIPSLSSEHIFGHFLCQVSWMVGFPFLIGFSLGWSLFCCPSCSPSSLGHVHVQHFDIIIVPILIMAIIIMGRLV